MWILLRYEYSDLCTLWTVLLFCWVPSWYCSMNPCQGLGWHTISHPPTKHFPLVSARDHLTLDSTWRGKAQTFWQDQWGSWCWRSLPGYCIQCLWWGDFCHLHLGLGQCIFGCFHLKDIEAISHRKKQYQDYLFRSVLVVKSPFWLLHCKFLLIEKMPLFHLEIIHFHFEQEFQNVDTNRSWCMCHLPRFHRNFFWILPKFWTEDDTDLSWQQRYPFSLISSFLCIPWSRLCWTDKSVEEL